MPQDHSNLDPSRAIVDARGLNCPLPVLRLRKTLLAGAGTVELLATDRAALRDVPAFCAAHGYTVEVIAGAESLCFIVTR